MIGAIIGAAVAAGSSIYGAAKSASAMRKARNEANVAIEKAKTRNENMLNYEMGTPRYSTQTVLNQTAGILRERKAARIGAKNVVGGTQASVQAGDTQDAEVLNNAAQAGISAGLDDRKRAVENYTAAQNQLDEQKAGIESNFQQGIAQNTAQAVQSVGAAAGQIASAVDSQIDANKAANESKAYSQVHDNIDPSKLQGVSVANTSQPTSVKTAGNTTSSTAPTAGVSGTPTQPVVVPKVKNTFNNAYNKSVARVRKSVRAY